MEKLSIGVIKVMLVWSMWETKKSLEMGRLKETNGLEGRG